MQTVNDATLAARAAVSAIQSAARAEQTEQRRATVKRACERLQAELTRNAPAIAKVLRDFDAEHAPRCPHCDVQSPPGALRCIHCAKVLT